jgi:hypothetical protein
LHRLHWSNWNAIRQAQIERRRDRGRDQDAGAAHIVVYVQAMLSRIVSPIIRRIVVIMMAVMVAVTMMNMVFVAMRVNVN